MNTRLVNYLLPSMLALFFMYGCSKDEDIEAACITSPPTEGFAGETITLQSCNQNMTEYLWDFSCPQSGVYQNFKGQTVDFTLPPDPGQCTIKLSISNNKGRAEKSFSIAVKASGSLISEGKNSSIQNLEAFQQPNGTIIAFAEYDAPGSVFFQYKWILSNKLQKVSFSPAQELSLSSYYYVHMKSLVTSDGLLLCGRDAGSKRIDTYLFNPDGGIIWSKARFPSTLYPSNSYPFVLIKDFRNGFILGESLANVEDKNESYVHNALGQGVSWTTKIAHTDNTTLRDITRGNNQYVILSIDSRLGSSFLDVLDVSGKIVDQKELKLSVKANAFIPNGEGGKILFSNNKFVLAVLGENGTNVYWMDQNFTIEKSVALKEEVVEAIHKTSSGYILFGKTFQVARLDNQGNLLSLGFFEDYSSHLESVITEGDGNFVLIGTSRQGINVNNIGNKLRAIRISPEGKVVQ